MGARYHQLSSLYHFQNYFQRQRLCKTIDAKDEAHVVPGAEGSRKSPEHHLQVQQAWRTGSGLVHRNLFNGDGEHHDT